MFNKWESEAQSCKQLTSEQTENLGITGQQKKSLHQLLTGEFSTLLYTVVLQDYEKRGAIIISQWASMDCAQEHFSYSHQVGPKEIAIKLGNGAGTALCLEL
jgi:hypothetical protein